MIGLRMFMYVLSGFVLCFLLYNFLETFDPKEELSPARRLSMFLAFPAFTCIAILVSYDTPVAQSTAFYDYKLVLEMQDDGTKQCSIDIMPDGHNFSFSYLSSDHSLASITTEDDDIKMMIHEHNSIEPHVVFFEVKSITKITGHMNSRKVYAFFVPQYESSRLTVTE